MRTTVIENVTVERKVPYLGNYHHLIDQEVQIHINAVEAAENRAVFVIDLAISFVQREDKVQMGRVSAKATTTITDTPIPLKDGKFDGDAAPENLLRLIEGAVGEEMLLPLSILTRTAKMPSIVPSPHIFPRPNELAEDVEEDVGESDDEQPPKPA